MRKEYCSIPEIPESELEDAFVTMFNKMRVGSKTILSPIISTMTEVRESTNKGNEQLTAIDKRLVELNDKKLLLTKLRTRGIMMELDYLNETVGIDQEMEKLRRDRKKALTGDDDLEQINQFKRLQALVADSEMMISFNPEKLTDIVDMITVVNRNLIRFRLLGGLEVNETLGEVKK